MRRLSLPDDTSRNAHDGGVRRDIVHDHGVGADTGAVANRDGPQDLRPCAEENVAAQDRALPSLGADGHLMFQINAATASDIAVDHDSRGVDKDEARPKIRAAADDAIAEDSVEAVEDHLKWNKSPTPRPLHKTVQNHRSSPIRE